MKTGDFNALVVMARLPRAGRVKSRLAASLGDEKSAEFYKLCAEQVLSAGRRLPASVYKFLFCADEDEAREAGKWAGPAYNTVVQKGDDIGERLENALRTVFNRGARKVVAVATDVPDLTAAIIKSGLDSLDSYDVTIGPCFDGGYYLIGMNRLHRQLFDGIPWSTDHTTAATLTQIERLGLCLKQLPTLWDIDSESDLKAWAVSGLTPQSSRLNRFVRSLNFSYIADGHTLPTENLRTG